ncbi:MAG: UDP-N-acetylglucosamine 2-epimerase (non-hydrolyzing) [Planctomycetota bacterium]|nr:UDP-N-acetylglucosamine 2-epimerase (non-hydrolyzing) [Planctomycetota bacterium]
MRLLIVYGTRPEFIKLAPVIRKARDEGKHDVIACSTGQHREMLRQLYDFFKLTPDLDLDIMKPGQSPNEVVARILVELDEVIRSHEPDYVLIQGDTSTVFASATAAFHNRVPVGHVEAGLRTYDISQPWPEEAYRCMVSRVANMNFCPTELSAANLRNEKVSEDKIVITGNTVIDSLLWTVDRIANDPPQEVSQQRKWAQETFGDSPVVLITGHRRESFGRGFEEICRAIAALASEYPGHRFVYPVHLNPNVQKPVKHVLGGLDNVHLIAPQPYPAFCWWMDRSQFVLTDSGGVQEEAPSLGKPVLVMRNTSERPEGIDAGCSRLVGNTFDGITRNVRELIEDNAAYSAMACPANPYGDGHASERILERV